ncbi:hypothetical protein EVAR_58775_1 [Eumeta japonica]|uniref:Uncharacterized protein n=1 Tax=Eumeta variegata TaxID=151549 RepID=A0A4C1YKH3_EUMVA|nr:hypothetical protein EVAR_58775_1 [Eumeta japonica]
MRHASERFFTETESQDNAFHSLAVPYEAPCPYHITRSSQNVITDSPDALTSENIEIDHYVYGHTNNERHGSPLSVWLDKPMPSAGDAGCCSGRVVEAGRAGRGAMLLI